MAEPFLGEIRLVGFNFAPRGWAFCDGQLLPINQNQSLYSLLGITYGGDGRSSFALPDLRGRTSIHASAAHQLGSKEGTEGHSLSTDEIPQHQHSLRASSQAADSPIASNNVLAAFNNGYHDAQDNVSLIGSTLGSSGSAPHNNMQPYLTLAFAIALRGLFPSRN